MDKKLLLAFYKPIFKIFRPRRIRKMLSRLSLQPSDCILDVGGYPGNWMDIPVKVRRIDVLNLEKPQQTELSTEAHEFRLIQGDGRALTFADGEYPFVFSNSVIEHLGNYEDQKRMAAELRRVGKALWIQTPAREFPFEVHYLVPFIHWLPKSWQRPLLRFTPWAWMVRATAEERESMLQELRLLTHREMQELFPDCEILRERFLFWTKSHVAFRRNAERRTSNSERRSKTMG